MGGSYHRPADSVTVVGVAVKTVARAQLPRYRTRRFRQAVLAVFDKVDLPVPAAAADTNIQG
jgi:hypothetical protein